MKALQVERFEVPASLRLGELPLPEPAAGQVRIRVGAAAISFVDLLVAEGRYQVRPALPAIGGSEFAGRVDACGEGVPERFAPGVPVAGFFMGGAWSEVACVPWQRLSVLAPGLSALQACVIAAPYGTAAYALLLRGALRTGETVFVAGVGGSVGEAAVQVARRHGARVIGGGRSEASRQAASRAGADAVIDTSATPAWKDELKRLAGPAGLDVVVDPVGGELTDTAFRALGWGGRHLMIGFASGAIGKLASNLALLKGAALVGVDVRVFAEREPAAHAALLQSVFDDAAQGAWSPRIGAVFELADYERAFALFRSGRADGRVVLRIGGD